MDHAILELLSATIYSTRQHVYLAMRTFFILRTLLYQHISVFIPYSIFGFNYSGSWSGFVCDRFLNTHLNWWKNYFVLKISIWVLQRIVFTSWKRFSISKIYQRSFRTRLRHVIELYILLINNVPYSGTERSLMYFSYQKRFQLVKYFCGKKIWFFFLQKYRYGYLNVSSWQAENVFLI